VSHIEENAMMPVIRVKHAKERPYLVVDKRLVCDREISLPARGLLCFMLSKPDDWDFFARQIAYEVGVDRHTIGTLLAELERVGYAERVPQREAGKFRGYDWTILEERKAVPPWR
jgi:hypothetical protein